MSQCLFAGTQIKWFQVLLALIILFVINDLLAPNENGSKYCYLSAVDPRPLSVIKKGSGDWKDTVGRILYGLWFDMTNRLVELGLSDRPGCKISGKVACFTSWDHYGCHFTDCSATRIPSSSIACHHLRLTLGKSYSLQRCSQCIL